MKIVKITLLLIIIWMLCSCSFSKAVPTWTKAEPIDPAFYSSVVNINKGIANYKDRAFDNAVKNISMQISVQVDAQLSLIDTESSGIPRSEFVSQIQTSSRALLTDVQLTGTYESKKEYWAYYRLSKDIYRSQRMRRRDLAVSQALGQLIQYDNAGSDIATGIPLLLEALEQVVDYLDLDLSADYLSQRINLYNELSRRLRQLPLQLTFSADPSILEMVAKQKTEKRILITLNYKKDDQQNYGCDHFPLVFRFSRGSGKMPLSGMTDSKGQYLLPVERITSFEANQLIEVGIDKSHYAKRLTNPIIRKLLDTIVFKHAQIPIRVGKPKVCLQYSFNDSKGTIYRKVLQDRLIDMDIDITDSPQSADYIIEVKIVSRPGTYISALNLHSAFGDVYCAIKNARSGEIIISDTIQNVKNNAPRMLQAETDAELSAVNALSDGVLYRLVMASIMAD
ncbi:MAG: LPP20 family lipoprotein [Candidatus Cloacimonadaceae bacterium]|nr:LPP20 family lipoprotein [Candidatus Cloacimonadaceae bacterium]